MGGAVDEHPAVRVVRRRLNISADSGPVAGFALRDFVAAVVIQADSVFYPVTVSAIGHEWVAPDVINGFRTDHGSTRPRRERSASPPQLIWNSMSSSESVESSGVAWTILIGQAALDGEQLTVESDVDVQSCPVGPDGFVMVFFRRSQQHRPRLTMRTTSGEDVTLFNGQAGHPR